MTILYHGSGYEQSELMPGYMRSGEKVHWDVTESNEWLYATSVMDEAISMGFASAIEKRWDVQRYSHDASQILIVFRDAPPKQSELSSLLIYLYEITLDPKDGWVKNANRFNGMENEYRTKHTVRDQIIKRERIDLVGWLKDKTLTLTDQRPASLRWD